MEKKRITIFFCDLHGTIDGGYSEEDIQKFSELLEIIKNNDGSDYLFFKIASTEQLDIVDSYDQNISKYFKENVLVLPKIPEAEAQRERKTSLLLHYINQLKMNYIINSVYFVDDSSLLHEIFKDLLELTTGLELNSIIPEKGENKLEFINEHLETKYIKNKTESKNKIKKL